MVDSCKSVDKFKNNILKNQWFQFGHKRFTKPFCNHVFSFKFRRVVKYSLMLRFWVALFSLVHAVTESFHFEKYLIFLYAFISWIGSSIKTRHTTKYFKLNIKCQRTVRYSLTLIFWIVLFSFEILSKERKEQVLFGDDFFNCKITMPTSIKEIVLYDYGKIGIGIVKYQIKN